MATFFLLLQTRTQLRPFKPPIPPKGNTPSGQGVGRCSHFLPHGMGHTNIFGTFNDCLLYRNPTRVEQLHVCAFVSTNLVQTLVASRAMSDPAQTADSQV